jgi:2-desacetyl-2-hydroxyethyl bacteriochlorophyllide A dehydrogenase
MNALIVSGPGRAEIAEVDRPAPGPGQVLVRVKYCGICGTDYAIFSGGSSFVKNGQITYPIRIGHEWSGVVEKAGDGVTAFKPGDPVVGDDFVSCGECPACARGEYNDCENKFNVGTIHPWDGAFADFVVFPERHLYRVSDGISLELAALCEPLSIAYGAVRRLNIRQSTTVAVIGTGSIGMCAAALALQQGAGQVLLVGRNPLKLDIALRLGVTGAINIRETDAAEEILRRTGGKGADCVIECSGAETSLADAIEYAAVRAKVMMVGFFEQKIGNFDMDKAIFKELTLTGIMGEYGNTEAVLKIMAQSDLRLEPIITDCVPFSEVTNALAAEAAHRHATVKTIVRMGDQEAET